MKKLFILFFIFLAATVVEPDRASAEKAFKTDIRIHLPAKPRPVNRMLLGNNIQWVDRGDELLQSGSLNFFPQTLKKVRRMGPTVLRYPGGSLSDHYHWQKGIGAMAQRKKCNRFNDNRKDTVLFGTVEFLELCRQAGAEPLITVNVVTGSVKEAVEWVKFTNSGRLRSKTGKLLPVVKYWEIGNEPYLIEESRRDLALTPEEYAGRANRFIKAMRSARPDIRVGIPLRSDSLGGIPATPMQGFNEKVLLGLTEPFDFVCLHNAYMPFHYKGGTDDLSLFQSAMAATRVVKQDIEATRSILKKHYPEKKIRLALTEYNALFTIGRGKTDGYISSLAASIYLADLIRMLSFEDDVLMANYWSLTGNWFFGTLDQTGCPRPSFSLLSCLNKIFRGHHLHVDIDCPKFDSKTVGFVPAQRDVPLVSAIGTFNEGRIALLLINKHPDLPSKVVLAFKQTADIHIEAVSEMHWPSMFSSGPKSKTSTWKKIDIRASGSTFDLRLKPHSITLLEARTGGQPDK